MFPSNPITRLVLLPSIFAIVFSLLFFAFMAHSARALEITCPQSPPPAPATSCKVLTLNPDEERALTATNGILDTARQGRPLDLTSAVTYFLDKLSKAVVVEPPAPAKPETKPADVPLPTPDPRKP